MQSGFKILKAAHLGMCFGVRDAIALARESAAAAPLTILGELVHNPDVLRDLEREGVRTAHQPDQIQTTSVMITAHGASDARIAELRSRGYRVTEATCPLVQVAHQAIRKLVWEGYHPVVIGRRNHVEVLGLTEDFADGSVVLSEADIDLLPLKARYGVIAQTTQPIDRVLELVENLRARHPGSEVKFIDTVCHPTKQRQTAAVDLASQCDVVLVIGGALSNNTAELVARCSRFCKRVFHIEGGADLRSVWFRGDETVGITAGTSTPDQTIAEVERWLEQFQAFQARISASC